MSLTRNSACIQTISYRVFWEPLIVQIMLAAGKSLLLGCRDDGTIANQRRGTVMIEGRNAEYVHQVPVNEGCATLKEQCRALTRTAPSLFLGQVREAFARSSTYYCLA